MSFPASLAVGRFLMSEQILATAGTDSSEGDELIRADRVAKMLGVSVPRAYAVMAQGRIPTVRIGRSVRVSRRQLERWIEAQSAASLAA
jgi:excisionase family DNA binding protein